jgi:hypothetical protein
VDDELVEGAEHFTVALTDPLASDSQEPAYLLASPASLTATVEDNDYSGTRPTIALAVQQNASESGGAAGSGLGAAGVLRVTLSETATSNLVVFYKVDSTSTAGANDFQALAGNLTIAQGQTYADIVVTPIDDLRIEATESLTLSITGADDRRYALAATHTATVTITDNEQPVSTLPMVTIVGPTDENNAWEPASGELGSVGAFVLSRTGNLTNPLAVDFAINGFQGSRLAELGTDFCYTLGTDPNGLANGLGTITFPANESTIVMTIHPSYDSIAEEDETVFLSLLAGTSGSYLLGSRPRTQILLHDNGEVGGVTVTTPAIEITAITKNEIQRISLPQSPMEGTFSLTYAGQTTASIAYDASAADVQSALQALDNLGPGSVLVTRDGADWLVEFKGTEFSGRDAPSLIGDGSDLTSTGSISVAELFEGTSGLNESQVVTISGQPGGGTFTLTFNGQTTAPIAFNASAAEVQMRLRALTNIGASSVIVTGVMGGPYTVVFENSLGRMNVNEMTANGAGLMGSLVNRLLSTKRKSSMASSWLSRAGERSRLALAGKRRGRSPTMPLQRWSRRRWRRWATLARATAL